MNEIEDSDLDIILKFAQFLIGFISLYRMICETKIILFVN